MRQDIPKKLQSLYSELRVLHPQIHFLSEGQSAWVLADNSIVIKVPKTQERNARLLNEAQFLKQFQTNPFKQIKIPLWQNTIHFQSLPAWDWAAIHIYSKIKGISWQLNDTTQVSPKSLKQFGVDLHALHQWVLPENFERNKPLVIDAFQSQICSIMQSHCTPRQFHLLNLWFNERCIQLSPFSKINSKVLIHGDLWAENFLLDSTQTLIVGLIDFEDWRYSELADELAALSYFPTDVSSEIIKAYFAAANEEPPMGLQSKIYDYLFLRELQGVLRNSLDSDPEIYKVLQILDA